MPVEIKCARCGHVVRRLFYLGRELREELKDLEGRRCPKCGHEFEGRLAGKIRLQGEKTYRCPFCGLQCKGGTWSLLGHIKKVHLRSNICPVCNTAFKELGAHCFIIWRRRRDLLHGLLWIAYTNSTSRRVIAHKKQILKMLESPESHMARAVWKEQ